MLASGAFFGFLLADGKKIGTKSENTHNKKSDLRGVWLFTASKSSKTNDTKIGASNVQEMDPKRVQTEGLKSQILGLFEYWKHPARSKTTRQEICANIEEHGSKEGPKSGPEITDSRAV